MGSDVQFLIGTQVDEEGQGIFAASLCLETGAMELLGPVVTVPRPTWLQADRARGLLFAVSELGNRDDGVGTLRSFRVTNEPLGLEQVDQALSLGGGPTHLAMSAGGSSLFAANFGGGNAVAVPVASDGVFGDPVSTPVHQGNGPHRRQTKPHPHGVTVSPCGKFLLVPDMGNDRTVVHAFDAAKGAFGEVPVSECPVPAGAGPRLIEFSPDGRFAYLLTELSAEIYVYGWNAETGELTELASVALDEAGAEGEPSAAGLETTTDGKFLLVTNRRTNAVQVYALEGEGGVPVLTQSIPTGGEKPWFIGFSPDESWLLACNQATNTVTAFQVIREAGDLRLIAADGALEVPTPTSTAFV